MRYFCLLGFYLGIQGLYGQQRALPREPIALASVIVINELPSEDASPFVKNTLIHEPQIQLRKEELQKLKSEANQKATVLTYKTPSTQVDGPIIHGTWNGNSTGSGTPLDNHLAISKNGKIVAVQNSNFGVYNTNGQQLQQRSLASIASSLGLNNTKYDPRVIYDPLHDRFILVFLNGSSASSSRVVVGFSATNDPTGAWFMYALNGNLRDNQIINQDVWTDFPSIGISTEELFITGNLFTNQGQGLGAGIWQIPLSEGYVGATLNPEIYVTNYFALCPVTGATQPYGPDMYFIRTQVGNSNDLYVHYITNSIQNGGTLNLPVTLNLSLNYSFPPDAPQKNTTLKLSGNDNRIQSAYLENNIIVFALNSSLNNKNIIYYGMVYLNSLGLGFAFADALYIVSEDYSIAYPNVVYAGCSGTNGNNSIIFVDYSSSNNFPGVGAIAVNSDGDYSEMVIAYEGSGPIGFGTSSPFRWGDYTGAFLRQDGSNEIWAYGAVGSSVGVNTPRLVKMTSNLCQTTANTIPTPSTSSIQISPNPFIHELSFDFEVPLTAEYDFLLYDLQGRLIKNLLSEKLYQGNAKFTMNLNALPTGTYFIKVTQNQNALVSHKVVKQ